MATVTNAVRSDSAVALAKRMRSFGRFLSSPCSVRQPLLPTYAPSTSPCTSSDSYSLSPESSPRLAAPPAPLELHLDKCLPSYSTQQLCRAIHRLHTANSYQQAPKLPQHVVVTLAADDKVAVADAAAKTGALETLASSPMLLLLALVLLAFAAAYACAVHLLP